MLKILELSKSYTALVLQDFSAEFYPGEVVVLVGENGAGKSTLSKIIAGIVPPDHGMMDLDGLPYRPANRRDAESLGVRIVTQELALIETLSVAENLMMNHLPHYLGWIDRRNLWAQANQILTDLGLGQIDPRAPISSLGIGHRQMIEIARGLMGPCKLLILDEPTATLTPHEADQLFFQLDRLKRLGTAVIYISHRFEELRRIADRAIVLRDGKVVLDHPMNELSDETMIQTMTGANSITRPVRTKNRFGPRALMVESLSDRGLIRDVSFDVCQGEIFGLAGLVGSGRTEVLRLIYGADKKRTGRVTTSHAVSTISDANKSGMGFVTEDRKGHGLLLDQSIGFNIAVADLDLISRWGWIRRDNEVSRVQQWIDRLRVHCRSVQQSVSELSGGNQQKVVLARQLYRNCHILLLDEPTRGVDVSARLDLYDAIQTLSAAGGAIIMVSSDLRELISVCDRIGVMRAGKLVDIFESQDFDERTILASAFGHQAPSKRKK